MLSMSGADPGILKTGGAKISLALNPAPHHGWGGEENGWGWFSAQKKGWRATRAPPTGCCINFI